MRQYEVRPGDSPAIIASRPEMAGCPRCSRDLVGVNPHKPTVVYPNGFVSFRDLRVGERLNLPDSWFDGSLDNKPRSYFASLPHPDGVTLAHGGTLGDQAALDAASTKVGALAALGDQPFSDAVNDTASAIDASVREVDEGIGAPALYAAPFAQAARKSTSDARHRNVDLVTAISAGDHPAAFQSRVDILHDFASAVASAGLALQAFHGDSAGEVQVDIGQATVTSPSPATVTAAAQAAAAAIAADPNYCTSVAQPRSAVNSALHAFKMVWNTANPSSPVPIGTSSYEQATADALARVIGTAPAACTVRTETFGSSTVVTPSQQQPADGLSVGAILGIGLLGAGVVGGAVYLATRAPVPRPQIRRVPYRDDTLGPWRKNP